MGRQPSFSHEVKSLLIPYEAAHMNLYILIFVLRASWIAHWEKCQNTSQIGLWLSSQLDFRIKWDWGIYFFKKNLNL